MVIKIHNTWAVSRRTDTAKTKGGDAPTQVPHRSVGRWSTKDDNTRETTTTTQTQHGSVDHKYKLVGNKKGSTRSVSTHLCREHMDRRIEYVWMVAQVNTIKMHSLLKVCTG